MISKTAFRSVREIVWRQDWGVHYFDLRAEAIIAVSIDGEILVCEDGRLPPDDFIPIYAHSNEKGLLRATLAASSRANVPYCKDFAEAKSSESAFEAIVAFRSEIARNLIMPKPEHA